MGASLARLALAAIAVMAMASIARAQPSPQAKPHVTATLIAETRNIVPGRPLQLALRQQIEPGWHTYWSNPGDSGLPTEIDWSLPPGFKAGPIVWPTPVRFAYGPVIGYGYKDEVVLPVTIDTPADLQPGTTVTISADANWLVCSEECVPEEARLSIALPVGTASDADPRWAEAFASTRARTPVPNPFPTTATATDDKITVRVATGDARQLRDVMFFPADQNVLVSDAPQATSADAKGLTLTLERDRSKPLPALLNGVLAFRDLGAQAQGTSGAITIATPIGAGLPTAQPGLDLLVALMLAIAGGIILNLMPCVLPVLSIKVLSLVNHAQSAPRAVRLQGVAYTAGVLISFAVVAAALIGLRAAGAEIGWGFQLQSPLFVTVMIYALFAVGLNLSGVFSFGERLTGVGHSLASRGGYGGSFFAGALATLVATPCTAPFMAAAMGYAITQPWYLSLAVFEAVGLGLALPYLLVAFSPRAQRFLPRPGVWMLHLKQFLAFPIYGTAVWLVFVLSEQAGTLGTTAALTGLVLIAFAAWLYETVRMSDGRWRRWGLGVSAASVIAALALLITTDADNPSRAAQSGESGQRNGLAWQPFSQAKIDELRAEGRPIFVDFTAAWCITCKVNERVALDDPAVLKAFADHNVAALRADWTRRDPEITRALAANGRAGVPLYLLYRKPATPGEARAPIILPQILTADTLLRELRAN